MTALDQAFIKAYLRRREKPLAAALKPTDPDPFGAVWEEPAGEPIGAKESPGAADVRGKAPDESPAASLAVGDSPPGGVAIQKPAALPLDTLKIGGTNIDSEVVAAIAADPRSFDSRQAASLAETGLEAEHCGPAPAAAMQTDAEVFRPLLRVDAVAWPEPSERLCRLAGEQINRVAEAIQKAAASGRRLIGLAGFSPSEGCTTVLLALARRLVEIGRKTLLLDADVANPGLPERLGLKVDAGWREVAFGQIALEEAVTESDRESLALLPYCGSRSRAGPGLPQGDAIDRILDRLAAHYDLVLIDFGGSLTAGGRDGALAGELAERMDSMLTVQDVRSTSTSRLAMLRQHLRRIGVAEAGVIENFTEG